MAKIIEYMPSRECEGYFWEDRRIQEVLEQMKVEGIRNGILNIRRRKKNTGLELSNQLKRPWQGSGFSQSQWISKPRKKYTDIPTLVVMYEKGEKKKRWDDQPLYLPTLILPKNKFFFMFNSS